MTAGRRDQLVIIQRVTVTQDDYGEEVETWATLSEEWMAIHYGRGDERRQAAVEQGQQSANFQALSNTETRSVTLKDRLVLDGYIWDIVGKSPDMPKRGDIEFTATATGEEYTALSVGSGQMDFSDPDNSGLSVLLMEDA